MRACATMAVCLRFVFIADLATELKPVRAVFDAGTRVGEWCHLDGGACGCLENTLRQLVRFRWACIPSEQRVAAGS